jgi:hypothetical protein
MVVIGFTLTCSLSRMMNAQHGRQTGHYRSGANESLRCLSLLLNSSTKRPQLPFYPYHRGTAGCIFPFRECQCSGKRSVCLPKLSYGGVFLLRSST